MSVQADAMMRSEVSDVILANAASRLAILNPSGVGSQEPDAASGSQEPAAGLCDNFAATVTQERDHSVHGDPAYSSGLRSAGLWG